ncbi:hypothetical protein FSARC_7614 [Fusarium sarcochroum]|uniref:Acyltransferase 3 domain-containing protein n=1 Tax=Fusarium sarcochroum TaxID=1208366 RepID=A0A8H4X755_9HYPO|nr:hypothetical protein FSARC_7614 [Fusarium sarcochroum]
MLPRFSTAEAPRVNDATGCLDQSWPRTVIRSTLLFLPSFLHMYMPTTETTANHYYEPLSRQHHRSDTAFLDGMRGLAALCVFLEHFLLPFWNGIFYAYGGSEESQSLAQLPIVRLVYSGSPMVCIFFVISGIVLSLKPARLAQEGQWLQFYDILGSMAFRRGIRLFVPCIVASFVHMLIAQARWCNLRSVVEWEGPPEIHDEFWLKQPHHVPGFWTQMSQWLDFLVDKVLIPSTWRGTTTGRDYGDLEHVEYGSQLWTVGIEYWSSILLFVVLLGTVKLGLVVKGLIITTLTGFSLWVSRWDIALFLFGSMLGHTVAFEPHLQANKKGIGGLIVFGPIFLLGLHLASYPELNGSQTAGFSWLPLAGNSRLWQSIGASMIVFSLVNLDALKTIFSCRVLLYLGRISFAVYITHLPLLGVVGWRLVAFIWTLTGRATYVKEVGGVFIAFIILLALQIWVADLFCRFVDEPCTRWASKVHECLTTTT